MKRVFFEKDSHKDYLFVIVSPESTAEIYKVNNFTDEMGTEYVYTLVGDTKTLNDAQLVNHVIALPNGKYKDYFSGTEVDSASAYIDYIIKGIGLNQSERIYLYVRDKK